ncbi:glycosyltransferase family 8 protein, partial [Campylobacter sp. 2018MI35]|uniref:glycosyltransferase family 8 protein n=1 Tax=Campylobacter sp. 2018MI34 TaxID=2800582 RepID=UPI001906D4D1
MKEIKPAFQENNIPIIFSCDDNYLSYLAVILNSIKINSDKEFNYDICILYDTLNQDGIKKIINFIQDINISIRFINISPYIYQAKKQVHFHTAAHFKESTYYRFFIPSIFKNYKKIIYLDCDMLILRDLKDLFLIDFDTSIAACKELVIILRTINKIDLYYIDFLNNKKPFKNIYNYIQCGVLVYNIYKCIENNFTQRCLETLKYLERPPIVDQDVINSAFDGDISFLDSKWNFTWNLPIKHPNFSNLLPDELVDEALKMINNPYIIHYNDIFKPWNSPHLPNAHLWWHYARLTPFYEEILFKNITQNSLNVTQNNFNFISQGAIKKIKTHLSFKLGKEILSVKENKLKMFILPFTLIFIYIKHKVSNLIFN